MSEKTGMSLHIGVNFLDTKSYPLEPAHADYPDGWDGALEACEYDAEAMCEIAKSQGFETKILRSAEATAEQVRDEIRRAGKTLKSGDIFFLTYAGHGGQVPDRSRDEKDDRLDETWCLFNRQFLDDEQYALYAEFEPGVRILILSDSCHSGSVSRGGPLRPRKRSRTARAMPPESVRPIYIARKKCYDRIQDELPQTKPEGVKAVIRLISACKDNQEADGDAFNGYFTRAVVDLWDGGAFKGTYDEFYLEIKKELERGVGGSSENRAPGETVHESELQTPNYNLEGAKDMDFGKQRLFAI